MKSRTPGIRSSWNLSFRNHKFHEIHAPGCMDFINPSLRSFGFHEIRVPKSSDFMEPMPPKAWASWNPWLRRLICMKSPEGWISRKSIPQVAQHYENRDLFSICVSAIEFLKFWLAAGEQFQYKLERPTGTQRCLLHHWLLSACSVGQHFAPCMASFAIFEHSFLQGGSVCRRENKRRASFGNLQRFLILASQLFAYSGHSGSSPCREAWCHGEANHLDVWRSWWTF